MKKIFSKSTLSVIILIILFASYYFEGDNLQNIITPETLTPTVESAQTIEATGDYFKAYFTNPPLDQDKPGIEVHLIDLINEADTSIHAAIYELDLENVADALIAAKGRGIEVQIAYDNGQIRDHEDRKEILQRLKNADIPVVPDKRGDFMHNKFFVIDGKTVWTGSFNITKSAAHRNYENAVVLEVPQLAQNYEREFSEMFNGKLFGPKSPSDTPYPQITINGFDIFTYFAPEDSFMEKVIAEVEKAQNSIDFLAFVFTDVDLGYTMSELALNDDLIVRGVFDANQDMGDSVCPYMMGRDGNIEGNGDIALKVDGIPGYMHEKFIIIDHKILIFGSPNYSNQANKSNDENLLIVHDPEMAEFFEQEFQKVFDQGVIPNDSCKKN